MPPRLQHALAQAPACRSCCSRARVAGFTTDVVEIDDKGAAYEGVTHLLRLGYRRVGFIGGLRGASTSRRRLDGYSAALRDWKIRSIRRSSSKATSASSRATAPASSCSKRGPTRCSSPTT